MSFKSCEVARVLDELKEALESGRFAHPRSRYRAEELLRLLDDVVCGRSEYEHYAAMRSLADQLVEECPDERGRNAGIKICKSLSDCKEIFYSHIETHHCPTGECVRLTPAPCQMACPAGIDIAGFIALISRGEYAQAVDLIRKDNPFPWVCGLICTHPCELMCVRGRLDSPIAIKHLHGFASERAMSDFHYRDPEKALDNGRKVCVIGAGPAGLSAAYYLALRGYRVTVIEALPMAGGMLMVGIPRFRLPREVIDREVAMIEGLGVEFRYNTRFGDQATFERLKVEGFGAFFIAIGAHRAYNLGVKGENEYPQVTDAISFLRRIAMGERHLPGKRTAIIGGGNVAIDAARTCLRLGSEEVTIIYRRTRSEMPASEEEIFQAEEEGVRFSFLTVPSAITGEEGRVTGLQCIRTELGAEDESGRRHPVPIEGSDYTLELDAVIPAIGQDIDHMGLDLIDSLSWSRRNTLVVRTPSMETTSPGIFAGGDVVLGPATVVEAIGTGKRAAQSIDRFFNGIPQPTIPHVPIRRQKLECDDVPSSTKMALRRPEMPLLGSERRRITFQQVELGYTESMAREEALRCLRCDVCIRCGRCVEICRDRMKINALQLGYLEFDRPRPTDFRVTAERCILCGACATNCPTGAMKMEDRDNERLLILCGTILNRLKLEYCDMCGEVLGPARYHDYISRRTRGISRFVGDKRLCVECARKFMAGPHADISPPFSKT